ncbi:GtrA family protein [Streptomyces asoensis]|uniref:GtrA family protein n=1 Tax=Streptomyces asoensis TaxID=249586 RepID=UPI0037AE6244
MFTSDSAPDRPPGTRTRRALTGEIMRFAAVGGLGVLVNFAVFNLCRAVTTLPVVRCSVISTSVAVLVNYLGFRYFAYRDRDKRRPAREFTLFVVFSIIGLVIENGVLYAATYRFGWDTALQSNLFKAIGLAAATGFRFWVYRTWVFRRHGSSHPSEHSPPQSDFEETRP